MTEKSEAKGKQYISFDNLIRAMHEANKSITYAGMNARQFREFESMNEEEWKNAKIEYNRYYGIMLVKDLQFYTLAVIGAAVAYFAPGLYKWIGCGIIGFLLFCFLWREGHRRGYFSGYVTGRERGIYKSFDVTPEDAIDIFNRSIQMEIAEREIADMEKRNEQNAK